MAADAVDAILEQWQRERPDLDVTATGILGRISRIAALVDQAMDRVFQPHGLTGGDFVVLAALRRSGTPYQLTPTALMPARCRNKNLIRCARPLFRLGRAV